MTMQQPVPHLRPSGRRKAQGAGADLVDEKSMSYRGVDIRIAVQRTPDYVFGRADLVAGEDYLGRLSIGNPRATPQEIQQRLAALAQARVDIAKAFRGEAQAGPDRA
ncbi:hypothetical protein GCM10007320_56000 [Pseudorhodoferax aquiterrae]|uniref:Uncharacterized protein n=1 Tax=Pseudorhodoferax aquiterrae TaxID=747304 RepID=A0ABQ3GC82_9BURK|nr:hypothetical protein [Pseudorhodoferax aquiterrae]GHC99413.1 hypothetical protein GCM10007320_56000 [Pseudorhodoferax aquiterrae]